MLYRFVSVASEAGLVRVSLPRSPRAILSRVLQRRLPIDLILEPQIYIHRKQELG